MIPSGTHTGPYSSRKAPAGWRYLELPCHAMKKALKAPFYSIRAGFPSCSRDGSSTKAPISPAQQIAQVIGLGVTHIPALTT